MTECYFIVYRAGIHTDNLRVEFQRLYRDGRDIMCDSLEPQWEPEDSFIITLVKTKTTRTREVHEDENGGAPIIVERCNTKVLDKMTIYIHNKQIANYIWWLSKNKDNFDLIKEMYNAHKFDKLK